jgi:hypothetical protein
LTAALEAVLAALFEAEAFEAVAFAAVLAVFGGIALLFFEDFGAEAAFPAVRVSRARLLDVPRLAAAAFFDGLEVLFLRVFCDTACARNCHAPVRCFRGNPVKGSKRLTDSAQNVPNIAHFPQKSMI